MSNKWQIWDTGADARYVSASTETGDHEVDIACGEVVVNGSDDNGYQRYSTITRIPIEVMVEMMRRAGYNITKA
jgi:hypothetical protein